VDGTAHFQTTLYTGNGTTQSIDQTGNSTFQPDMVWIKPRSAAYSHFLTDIVRGVGQRLVPDSTAAEDDRDTEFSSFDSDGFSVGMGGGQTNTDTHTIVAWQWLADNTAGETLTTGTIDSVVAANQTAGFSIFKTTLGASSSTLYTAAHGLSSAPEFWIAKEITNASGPFNVYHTGLLSPQEDRNIKLNVDLVEEENTLIWGSAAPTSSVISFNTGSWGTSKGLIVWCWHSVSGFSDFGNYKGNGNADGPFVHCGFRPAFVMVKKTTTAGNNWAIYDTARDPSNVLNPAYLRADITNAEGRESDSSQDFDILSNGFKVRNANAMSNTDNVVYIYMAWAEHPFGGSGASPVTAR